ncbi:MAG: rhomboid family intramembrane serine protease [Cyclobacteriaceae bacterium]
MRLAFLMLLFFLVTHYLDLELNFLGNRPRTLMGLAGILFAPLLHVSWLHILSNVFPLLFFGTLVYWFYPPIAQAVLMRCYFLPSVLVWLIAMGNLHIGASGMIYGLAFFLIFFGFFRKDMRSLLISIVVIAFYGSLFYGVLPGQPGVSWEYHLAGAVTGLISAFEFSKVFIKR